jgi:hypothetical protein
MGILGGFSVLFAATERHVQHRFHSSVRALSRHFSSSSRVTPTSKTSAANAPDGDGGCGDGKITPDAQAATTTLDMRSPPTVTHLVFHPSAVDLSSAQSGSALASARVLSSAKSAREVTVRPASQGRSLDASSSYTDALPSAAPRSQTAAVNEFVGAATLALLSSSGPLPEPPRTPAERAFISDPLSPEKLMPPPLTVGDSVQSPITPITTGTTSVNSRREREATVRIERGNTSGGPGPVELGRSPSRSPSRIASGRGSTSTPSRTGATGRVGGSSTYNPVSRATGSAAARGAASGLSAAAAGGSGFAAGTTQMPR